MSKLPEETAQRIAWLINDITVGDIMAGDTLSRDYVRWRDFSMNAVIALSEEYGIDIPTLLSARRWFAEIRPKQVECLNRTEARE